MAKEEHAAQVQILTHLLRAPLTLRLVERMRFPVGPGARDTVISTSRLILILDGELEYAFEGQTRALSAGTQLFVPAWCRRSWSVPEGKHCEICWVEYDDEPRDFAISTCYAQELTPAQQGQAAREHSVLHRRWGKCRGHPDSAAMDTLQMEAQFKGILAGFWAEAAPLMQGEPSQGLLLHPAIKQALHHIDDHFTEPDVLQGLPRQCGLTPNYFRERFRGAMACTPGEYLKRLRMRQARYLLHSTDWQHKRIAAEVGYPDALYFSKAYRQFWGHSPREETSRGA